MMKTISDYVQRSAKKQPVSWPGLDPAIQSVVEVVRNSLDYPVEPGNDVVVLIEGNPKSVEFSA